MKFYLYFFVIFVVSSSTFGQSRKLIENPIENKNSFSRSDELNSIPARGGSVDWGLALSGGGIRASAFSIGVMKALYDAGIMDNIDVVSSVSGGSYASYWLIANSDLSNPNLKFGESAFGNARYVRNICKLQEKSNFVENKNAIKALVSSNEKAFKIYEAAILNTYGYNLKDFHPQDSNLREIKINSLNPYIKSEQLPYLIFNTTLKEKGLDLLGQVVEITPEYMGNPNLGQYRWQDHQEDKNKIFRLSEVITMSGAAVRFKLGRSIDNYAKEVLKRKKIKLSDGGHSENLGALALIRRGIKNIIVVDAEHDPKYKFEAYVKLRRELYNMGVDFCIPGIGQCTKDGGTKFDFSKSAVIVGSAKSIPGKFKGEIPIDSKIYYIKMSRPASIFSDDTLNINNGVNGERIYRKDVLKKGETLFKNRNLTISLNEPDYSCEKAIGFSFDRDMYYYKVNDYYTWFKGTLLNKAQKIFPRNFKYNFPQISTYDQTFYADQLEALVALGYLEGAELKLVSNEE